MEPETKVFKTKAKMRRASIPWLAAFVLDNWFRVEALSVNYLRILLDMGYCRTFIDFPSSAEKKTSGLFSLITNESSSTPGDTAPGFSKSILSTNYLRVRD